MANEESIVGLLLRAHAETAAQAHGERYHLKNDVSAVSYDMAVKQIENAIHSVIHAERCVVRHETRKACAEEQERARKLNKETSNG